MRDFNEEGFPARSGIYLAKGVWTSHEPTEIGVYHHLVKGYCCFVDDYGWAGSGVDDSTGCHASVGFTGLEFISRVEDLAA
jgi:hypothetical protein